MSELERRLADRLAMFGAAVPGLAGAQAPAKAPPPAPHKLIPTYGETLVREAETESRLVALDADPVLDTGLVPFRDRFPERFFECGMWVRWWGWCLPALATHTSRSDISALGAMPGMALWRRSRQAPHICSPKFPTPDELTATLRSAGRRPKRSSVAGRFRLSPSRSSRRINDRRAIGRASGCWLRRSTWR